MKIDIISGFLGAGKTTLIKKLLTEKLHNEKVVLIENEFGEVGVDGELLKDNPIEIKEINLGCICCTLQGNFIKALNEVVNQFLPDRIIIEPSGVAKLSDVVNAVQQFSTSKQGIFLNMLITVVDVLKYEQYMSNFGEFYLNQVLNAKTIILSRTNEVNQESLDKVINNLKSKNENAVIMTVPWEKVTANEILSMAEQNKQKEIQNCSCSHGEHTHHDSSNIVFESLGLKTSKYFSEKEIMQILRKLSNSKQYGTILRGKGILAVDENKWVQFDYTPGEIILKETTGLDIGKISIIGTNLCKDRIRKKFN